MEFGVQTRGGWEEIISAARWAEDRGLAAFALPDHYLQRGDHLDDPAYDHLIHLGALAAVTDHLELVSLVSPVTFRHPGVLYKMGVTIDDISGGRFTLGLGAGWMEAEFTSFGLPFPDLKTRMAMYEEAMAYMRAAMTQDGKGFQGEYYQLEDFDPQPAPGNLRLMGGGAGGPKARRIIALYGDEYNLYATTPDKYRKVLEATRTEAEQSGRDPNEIKWTSSSPAIAAKKETDYRKVLGLLAKRTGQPVEKIEKVYEERGWPHGSGSKAAEMIAALAEAGCERFFPQIFTEPDEEVGWDTIMDAYQG